MSSLRRPAVSFAAIVSRRAYLMLAAMVMLLVNVPSIAAAQTLTTPTTLPATPAPASSPAGDPIAARAKEWLGRLQQTPPAIDRSQLTPALSQTYDDVTVAAMARQVAGFGAPTSFVPGRVFTLPDGSTAHVYRITWPAGALDFLFALDANNKISAMYFRPA